MSDPIHLACPHCGTTNRLPRQRLGDGGKCGKCHNLLFEGKPIALDQASFERHANADLPLLVDVWAAWCGPCRIMGPIFEKAAHDLEPLVRLAKLDSEAEPHLAGRLGIQSIPTLILFRGGRELGRRSGVVDQASLTAWVRGLV